MLTDCFNFLLWMSGVSIPYSNYISMLILDNERMRKLHMFSLLSGIYYTSQSIWIRDNSASSSFSLLSLFISFLSTYFSYVIFCGAAGPGFLLFLMFFHSIANDPIILAAIIPVAITNTRVIAWLYAFKTSGRYWAGTLF